MKRIYAQSWALFRRNAPALFAVILLFEVMLHLVAPLPAAALYWPLYAYVTYRALRVFLRDGPEGSYVLSIFSHGMRMSFMKCAKFLAALLVLNPLPVIVFLGAIALAMGEHRNQMWDPINFIAIILVTWLLQLVTMSLFGTILPAVVDQDPKFKISDAFTFWPLLMRKLLLGAAPFVIASLSLTLVVISEIQLLGSSIQFWLNSGLSILLAAVDLFGAIILSATLCSVYRMIVPAPEPSVAE